MLEFVKQRFGDEGLARILGDAALPNSVSFTSGCAFADKVTYRILGAAAARAAPPGVAIDSAEDSTLHEILFEFGIFFVSWAQIAGYEKVSGQRAYPEYDRSQILQLLAMYNLQCM